ncbi:hypothetical protein Sgly_2023 [Syntrophobotulus glycolicus DSM 8271]|uniref:Uncharacterized protein n=1 Tax=Syntrophobotulus glycolicus (strain DSM 8271 / FlGlyR) TaxID=645991 RepID=F0T1H5_SYNGF|nr:hypothetical protein [Syntrophobotulus glycolicus]ADY56316.1 hypothetical protein Sgly_2023 [Syntrophobotulus glycolicus DSM 8271]
MLTPEQVKKENKILNSIFKEGDAVIADICRRIDEKLLITDQVNNDRAIIILDGTYNCETLRHIERLYMDNGWKKVTHSMPVHNSEVSFKAQMTFYF